jgi:hypothetical protein
MNPALSYSTTVGMDAASEDGPSVSSSTKPRTHAAKDCRASNYTSASCLATSSTLSYPKASSRWSANQARPGGSPSSRSQILVVGHLSFEWRHSTFSNSVTSSPTTSTQMVLSGDHPVTDSVVEDTTT